MQQKKQKFARRDKSAESMLNLFRLVSIMPPFTLL
jgi:hypothetical protein